jgi:hypothetical protein
MCETEICLTPMLPGGVVMIMSLVSIAGLIIWKLIKSLVDTIPGLG